MAMTRVSVLSSGADFGTRSISASYKSLVQPESFFQFVKGFRRMGPGGWMAGGKFVREQKSGTLLCLFNAPILLSALFRHRRNVRCSGVLDWTESYPSQRRTTMTPLYDRLYVASFKALDAVYSPSRGFREYYNRLGASIQPCLYPLPCRIPSAVRTEPSHPVRILYIGADCRRKGGDVLLNAWKMRAPVDAVLTFVSPSPPEFDLKGVVFRRDIKAGTGEQRRLFEEHDIFVLPTREEPFGFALLEAINSGMCAVTTEAAGAADIVRSSGGIVASTPEEAVKAAWTLAASSDEIRGRRAKCMEYLPHYEQAVQKSVREIIGSIY